jgi:hypothetical protein
MEQAIVADGWRARARPPDQRPRRRHRRPTIVVHGTDAQKRRYLRKILTAEDMWCQLYSEPNAGSDLAALRTAAEDRGDHFLVNGQKIWTSGGAIADWGLLLARTDPAVAKHKGISCTYEHAQPAGVDVRPLKQITGSSGSGVFADQRAGGEGGPDRAAGRGLGHRADHPGLRAGRPRAGPYHQLPSKPAHERGPGSSGTGDRSWTTR